jgi:hypothetical protein
MSMFHVIDEHDDQPPRMTMFRTLGVDHGVGYGHGVVPVPERGHDHGVDHADGQGDVHERARARGSSTDLNRYEDLDD